MKPPFSYYGGKTRLAGKIADLLPDHSHYIEPYAGSLAVFLAKTPAKMETLNDLDGDLMTFWRVLRDQPEDLIRVAALTPHGRQELLDTRDLSVDDDLERARRVWVQLTQGRTGTLRQTGWRYYVNPRGSSSSMPRYLAGYVGRMPEAAARLKNASLESRDALEVIRQYGSEWDACLYVDPPYLGSTRAAGYRHEMTSDRDHELLAEALNDCKAAVVLSGYRSKLYDELYDGWHWTTMQSGTGQGSGEYEMRTEVLWSNRPLNVGEVVA